MRTILPVALALLRVARRPIAAPSANRSESISPTTAEHVADSLGGFVDDLLVLDGGPCEVGIESTVVDVTSATARVLRPGRIRIGEEASALDATPRGPARSPGHRSSREPCRARRRSSYAKPVAGSCPSGSWATV